jgi:lipopolysaccharide/colanic/teichoic acid biosynthesis glycosyltransferase
MKRLFDIACSIAILSITAPLLIVVIILITLESRGPALYRSLRMGRNGRRFGMLRLRTMERLYEPADAVSERVETRVGHVMRNYSIDDLPNLWNVLKGDMSIIGPRATEPHLVDLASPEWQTILSVKPGWVGNAVLSLGSAFNASSPALRQTLELGM